MLLSVTYTGRIACHGRTLSVFIGGRDRVGGGDTGNATTRSRLLLLSQNLFQLLLHLGLVENTGSSPSSSRKTRSHRRRRCGVTATSTSASASASSSSTTTGATSSTATSITGGRRRVLTRDASRSFTSSSSSCQRCGVCHCGRTS